MKLLIDLGNSRCKCAMLVEQRIQPFGALALSELARLPQLLRHVPSQPQAVYAISVADTETNRRVADIIRNVHGQSFSFLERHMPVCGMRSRYQASQLGIDRLAGIVACWRRLMRSAIVVGCGTAITVDYIDGQGIHQGGVIMPSDELMRAALSRDTAQLEYFEDARDATDIFALNTKDAISYGCRSAAHAAVFQQVQTMRAVGDSDAPVLTSGGGADSLLAMEPPIDKLSVVETLIFEGILALAEGEKDG